MKSTDVDLAEGLESASKQQEQSASAQVVEQPPAADLISSGSESAASESMPAPKLPAQANEAAGSSTSSSVSPQPSLQLQTGVSQEQQNHDLPSPAAPAAQVAGPAPMSAQQHSGAEAEEGPWQEVRTSRRKPASQLAPSKASARQAAKHGRGAHRYQTSAPSQSCLGQLAGPAQQAPQGPKEALGPREAQPVRAAAEHSPYSLPASAEKTSQQRSHHEGQSLLQHAQSRASPFSTQHRLFQAETAGTMMHNAHPAPQQVLPPGLSLPFSLPLMCILPSIEPPHNMHFTPPTSQKSLSTVTCHV